MSHYRKIGFMAGVNIPAGGDLETGNWRAQISYPVFLKKDSKKNNDYGTIEVGIYASGAFGTSNINYSESVFEGSNLVTYSGSTKIESPKAPNIGIAVAIPLNFMKNGPTPPKGRDF